MKPATQSTLRKQKETTTFLLELDKQTINFDNKYIGWHYSSQRFTIKNPTKTTYAYKVKTNSRTMFQIQSPVGFLAPGDSDEVVVSFRPGLLVPPKQHAHLCVVSYVEALDSDLSASDSFDRRTPEGVKHLPFVFPEKVVPPKFVRPPKKFNIDNMPIPKELLAKFPVHQRTIITDKKATEAVAENIKKK